MSRFSIGDLAVIVGALDFREFEGRIVEITGALRPRIGRTSDGRRFVAAMYEIRILGKPGDWSAYPNELRPLPPPDDVTTTEQRDEVPTDVPA